MLDEILDFYNVSNLSELIAQEDYQLSDSVIDAFCQECGEYYGQLEPDATDVECPCCGEPAVASLLEILLFG
jgi:hypothetical protein